ncbi:unnamed protein product [Schistosoma curassoni]|uniref:MBF1 domain-containing protein n=1 Tax=Schistosoma curassoni TaxID=6186 RepID=A0A183KR78_9TREM|nr:unnamed protein product [Schistosoma curassoni]
MENNCEGIKDAITSTCHEVLGHKKHRHKEWITVDTQDMIQGRTNKKGAINTSRTIAVKAKSQAEYTETNKQVERSKRGFTDVPIDVGSPTVEEISMAIRQIRSGKAAEPDSIPVEALKANVAVTAKKLNVLFSKIWDEEQVPTY